MNEGYITKWDTDNKTLFLEHRRVMENHIGRRLRSDEDVHHLDQNKKNNDISNLIVLSKEDHGKLHAYILISIKQYWKEKKTCEWCRKTYGYKSKTGIRVFRKSRFCSIKCGSAYARSKTKINMNFKQKLLKESKIT